MNNQKAAGLGFPILKVAITGIDTSQVGPPNTDPKGIALTVDSFGYKRKIGVSTILGSGAYPQTGEEWVIDRTSLGDWAFIARIVPVIPEAHDLPSLLAALDQLGIIKNTSI